MVAQEKVEDVPKEQPPDQPPPVSTSIAGNGPPDGFGLSGGPGGAGGRGFGRRFSERDRFAAGAQNRIREALHNNRKTRAAKISDLTVRLWPDTTGRVTRAQLVGSTGDSALDSALTSDALLVQLPEPPPQGTPLPVVIKLSARRPN
jgi:outer membrane biosynthesis protein TonB